MRWQPRGLWKNPDFRKVWLSRTISNMGNEITGVALPVIAIQVLSATPEQISVLSALNGMAALLFGLAAGVWVDRVRRRPLMIATDLARALLVSLIPVAALFGILNIEHVYIVAALAAILAVFFQAADVAFFPGLVEARELVEGNSKLGASDALAEIAGPGTAGTLIQLFSAPLSMFIDGFSFLASAFFLARIRKPEPDPIAAKDRGSAWHESVAGLRFVLKNPLLRALAGSAALFNFFGMFVGTLYALYVIRTLSISPFLYGLLIATGGVSALVGTWLAERVVRRFGLGFTIGGGLFAYGLLGLLVPFAHGPIPLVVALLFASQLIGDVSVSIHLIAELSLRQMLVPRHLLGRANASILFLTRGTIPPGALLAGIIAERFGVRFTLFIGVLGVMMAGLWLLLSPVRRIRELEGLN
ncbi:MAG TPA: MFS transporter [Ktedonobacteraceae bacterium]|nr:MFS transporter [Ktedonobacteraceae bacterium]